MTNPCSIAERYSSGARAYQELWADVLLPHGKKLVDALPFGRAKRIVDIACGCGTLLPDLQDASAPNTQIIGVDISPGMVALAQDRFPVAVMDAAALGLATGAFDGGVMAFALFFMPDVDQVLREVRRVVRRGGVFGLTSWFGEPSYPAQDIWTEEIVASGAQVGAYSATAINPLALHQALERAGFESVRVWADRFDYHHPRDRFLELRTGLAARWLASLDTVAREQLIARVRSRLATLPDDGFLDPTEILFATAT